MECSNKTWRIDSAIVVVTAIIDISFIETAEISPTTHSIQQGLNLLNLNSNNIASVTSTIYNYLSISSRTYHSQNLFHKFNRYVISYYPFFLTRILQKL